MSFCLHGRPSIHPLIPRVFSFSSSIQCWIFPSILKVYNFMSLISMSKNTKMNSRDNENRSKKLVRPKVKSFKARQTKKMKELKEKDSTGNSSARDRAPTKEQKGLSAKKRKSTEDAYAKKIRKKDTSKSQEGKQKKIHNNDNTSKSPEMKQKKDRKKMRQKSKNPFYELAVKAKQIWEVLRREDCPQEKRKSLLDDLSNRIKGHVKQLIFAHDTSRVIECIMQLGDEKHRTWLFEELKDYIVLMAKSKYAKFFVIKILRYGTKEQRQHVMKSFHGHVVSLLRHTEASAVVEYAYNEYANATQRAELVQEVYGPNFALFKDPNCKALAQILEKEPSMKENILGHIKESLLKLVDKSVIRHSIIHHILLEFFRHADPQAKTEVIGAIKEAVPEILHTKDGAKVAAICVWHGTAKDRKVIIKGMKTLVVKIAKEEHGHQVLLAIFDCVDDTKLVEKIILSELLKNPMEVVQDQYGRKVLWYLIAPRDPMQFHPDVVNFLKQGDDNGISKKDPEVRRQELRAAASPPLLAIVENHIKEIVQNNNMIVLILAITNNAVGDCTNAFSAVVNLINEPYFFSLEAMHFIEHPGTSFLLKKLILGDAQRKTKNEVLFSCVLVEKVSAEIMASWLGCNRGAFVLLSLLETGIEKVVIKVKETLTSHRSKLKEARKKYKGAKLLYEKMQDL